MHKIQKCANIAFIISVVHLSPQSRVERNGSPASPLAELQASIKIEFPHAWY